MCVRASVRAHMHVCTSHTLTHSLSCFCVRFTSRRESLFQYHPFFGVLCAPGSPWSSRWRSCIEHKRISFSAPCSSCRTAWHCCRNRPLRPPSWASGASRHSSQAPWPTELPTGGHEFLNRDHGRDQVQKAQSLYGCIKRCSSLQLRGVRAMSQAHCFSKPKRSKDS
jgi:hypothetical protein